MKLLTKEIREKLPKLYSQEGKGRDAVAHVKFFCPWNHWTWYTTEGEPIHDEDGSEIDFRFFGHVTGDFDEFGYFHLSELESIRGPFGLGIERDLHWRPRTLNEIAGG